MGSAPTANQGFSTMLGAKEAYSLSMPSVKVSV